MRSSEETLPYPPRQHCIGAAPPVLSTHGRCPTTVQAHSTSGQACGRRTTPYPSPPSSPTVRGHPPDPCRQPAKLPTPPQGRTLIRAGQVSAAGLTHSGDTVRLPGFLLAGDIGPWRHGTYAQTILTARSTTCECSDRGRELRIGPLSVTTPATVAASVSSGLRVSSGTVNVLTTCSFPFHLNADRDPATEGLPRGTCSASTVRRWPQPGRSACCPRPIQVGDDATGTDSNANISANSHNRGAVPSQSAWPRCKHGLGCMHGNEGLPCCRVTGERRWGEVCVHEPPDGCPNAQRDGKKRLCWCPIRIGLWRDHGR